MDIKEETKFNLKSLLNLTCILTFTILGVTSDVLMIKLMKQMKNKNGSEAQLVPWVSNGQNNNYNNMVPRNSSLISTLILFSAGLWFAFVDTLAGTLFVNVCINLFLIPILIRFTVSSSMKKNIVVPSGLQFHEPDIEKGLGNIKVGNFLTNNNLSFIFLGRSR